MGISHVVCHLLSCSTNPHPIKMQASYDSAGLNRYTSPGAGAITPWFNRSSVAMRDIKAGLELFVDYGQGEWRM